MNTEDFLVKIKNAINPLNKTSSPVEDEEVTELYGFIWIIGTLIFFMFVSSTGSNLLSNWLHNSTKKKYEYDFNLLLESMGLFYGYNILVPLILYGVTTYILKFPHKLSLSKVISIYGYTNVLWFPITVINILIVLLISNEKYHTTLNVLEWIIVLISGAVTGLSNISKIGPIIQKNSIALNDTPDQQTKLYRVLIFSLALSHMIFTVIVKICFFGVSV